jgi:Tfp pilus assembly PilM family ATPase
LSSLGIDGRPAGPPPGAAPVVASAPAPRGSLRERFERWLLEPPYPMVALEVRPRSIGAVRVTRQGGRPLLAAAASLSLPDGVLALSMAQPNVLSAPEFRETLRAVLERAGIPLSGAIGLVLPDPVARVSLVPAAELASKDPAEIEEMLRFRLRKAVPFDIKDARVVFRMPRSAAPEALALAVVIARPILEGYEDALGSLGLHPGLVELAGLSILTAIEASHPAGDRLVVNWDEGYVSLLLTRAGEPVLMRTLTGEAASTHEDIIREVANTVLYYREKLGGAGLASVVVRSGVLAPSQAVELLKEPLGMTPMILDPWAPPGEADDSAAGQAVAGAAACVVGKVV